MQFPAAAVVVQAIGDVGALLDLTDRQSGTDGMDGAGWDEEGVSWSGGVPFQQMFDLTVEGGCAGFLFGDGFPESSGNFRAGFRRQHVPHLGLARGIVVEPSVLVIGMNLYGEIFAGEEEFHQQGHFGGFKPDFTDGLGVGLPGIRRLFGELPREPGSEVRGSPDALVKARLELAHFRDVWR